LKRSNIIFIDEAPQPPADGLAEPVTEPAMEDPKKELLLDATAPPLPKPPPPETA
jgi:hypothetical protein